MTERPNGTADPAWTFAATQPGSSFCLLACLPAGLAEVAGREAPGHLLGGAAAAPSDASVTCHPGLRPESPSSRRAILSQDPGVRVPGLPAETWRRSPSALGFSLKWLLGGYSKGLN